MTMQLDKHHHILLRNVSESASGAPPQRYERYVESNSPHAVPAHREKLRIVSVAEQFGETICSRALQKLAWTVPPFLQHSTTCTRPVIPMLLTHSHPFIEAGFPDGILKG